MRWACLLLVCLTASAFPQQVTRSEPVSAGRSDTTVVVGRINISGNKITRENIILREVELKPGEKISLQELNDKIIKSRQNLMNRGIFNFVDMSFSLEDQQAEIDISVTERWYIWPIPILNTAGRNLNAWWEDRDPGQLNYGVDLTVRNFRGRLELLNIIVQGGYDQVLSAKWTIPYLTADQFLGTGIGGGLQFNRQIAYKSTDNKQVFHEASEGYAQERIFASFDITLRPRFNYLHTFTMGFNHYEFQDTLLILNPNFAFGQSRYDFMTFSYLYKHDFRDYLPYPLEGYYLDAGFTRYGLGMTDSDLNIWAISFTFDHYIRIYKRWFFAYSMQAFFSDTEQFPYFMTPALGYKGREIRGYELYFIEGQDFGLLKSNFKFEIIPMTEKRIKWIKTEKFGKVFYALYANLFFDMAYARDQQNYSTNPRANQLLWGTGVGIDFVTYYDLVIRFEYTVNKQAEQGFFINLVAPI